MDSNTAKDWQSKEDQEENNIKMDLGEIALSFNWIELTQDNI
jgi:hypothetical protein